MTCADARESCEWAIKKIRSNQPVMYTSDEVMTLFEQLLEVFKEGEK
jgi:hypothetical protein